MFYFFLSGVETAIDTTFSILYFITTILPVIVTFVVFIIIISVISNKIKK